MHRRAAAQKAYIAIHIELLENLSAQAFLAAFRRFAAHRGIPAKEFSDSGLNFKGASNSLKELYDMCQSERNTNKVQLETTQKGIEWEFIPTRAPNFGGLWGGCCKGNQIEVIGTYKMSLVKVITSLTQVEAQLKSRPLTPMSKGPDEIDVLTPGHFLTGIREIAYKDPCSFKQLYNVIGRDGRENN